MKIWTLIVAVVGFVVLPASAMDLNGKEPITSIHFDTDKSDIRASETEKLQLAADRVLSDKLVVAITGHADMRGDRLYNLDLGERRARAVGQALITLGAPADQLVISVSYGEEKPLAPNDRNSEHLQSNRRVDITLVRPLTVTMVVKEKEVVREGGLIKDPFKNRVSLYGGAGPNGLNQANLGPVSVRVEQYLGPVFGLNYTRMISKRFGLGGTAFTNNSYFLNVSLDF